MSLSNTKYYIASWQNSLNQLINGILYIVSKMIQFKNRIEQQLWEIQYFPHKPQHFVINLISIENSIFSSQILNIAVENSIFPSKTQ